MDLTMVSEMAHKITNEYQVALSVGALVVIAYICIKTRDKKASIFDWFFD